MRQQADIIRQQAAELIALRTANAQIEQQKFVLMQANADLQQKLSKFHTRKESAGALLRQLPQKLNREDL